MVKKASQSGIRPFLACGSALAAALALIPSTAQAQGASPPPSGQLEEIGDIIVTATRRETSLQSTPLSITAVSGDELNARGLRSAADVVTLTPGVALLNGEPGRNQITIRGVGTATATDTLVDGISNATTSVYLNQLPVTSTISKTPDYRFVDLERVEVLRGPQGTLYGQSAMGGVVRYISNRPDPGRISAGVNGTLSFTKDGGTNFGLESFANVPLVSDKLAVRFVAYGYDNDGFIDVVGTSRKKNANKEGTIGGRAALRWNITDGVTLDLTYLHHEVKLDSSQTISGIYTPTTYAYSNTNPFALPYYFLPPFAETPAVTPASTKRLEFMHLQPLRENADAYNAELRADLGQISINAILGRKDVSTRNFIEGGDFSGGSTGSFTNPTGRAKTSTDTAEIRILSNWENAFVDFIVGGYYEKTDGRISQKAVQSGAPFTGLDLTTFEFVTYAQPGDVTIDAARQLDFKELAVYGELTFNLSNDLKLTGGYRHARVKNNYQWIYARGTLDGTFGRDPRVVQGATENVDLYKANLSYRVTKDILFYAQAASGYRPGGFNAGIAIYKIPDTEYNSDNLWNYEAGIRTSWFNRRFILNVAGYRIDWSKIQLLSSLQAPSFYSSTQNVGKARIWGAEVEATARLTNEFSMSGAYSYTDATLKSISTPRVGTIPQSYVGAQLPGTPKNSFSVLADWRSPLTDTTTLVANSTFRHIGSRPGDLGTVNTRAPAYDQLDLQAGVDFKNGVSLRLFGENVTNKIAINRITPTPLPGYRVYWIGKPRVIGVRASFRY
jgi:outer membrane receptor protein involved in Fe transport